MKPLAIVCRKYAALLLLVPAFLFSSALQAQEEAQPVVFAPYSHPATPPPENPKVGLVLEGGGALGLAHIGVLKWLEEHHIPLSYIAGTSMGGLVSGVYATGHNPAETLQLIQRNQLGSGSRRSGSLPGPLFPPQRGCRSISHQPRVRTAQRRPPPGRIQLRPGSELHPRQGRPPLFLREEL